MPEPRELVEYKTDHDLLIELRTVVLLMKESLDKLTGEFVTRAEFAPVKIIAYGLVSIVMLAVVGAVVSQVLVK